MTSYTAYIIGTAMAIISTAVSVGIAYGALRQRLISHEARDDERFSMILDLLMKDRH